LTRSRLVVVAALTTVVSLVATVPSAGASFHDIRISKFFRGPADVSFVELQMTAPGQNFTAGQTIKVYDSTGANVHTSPVFPMVPNGDSQRTILIGDTAAGGSPDVTDGTLYQTLNADANGGAICYGAIDCVAWGPNFMGAGMLPSPAGTPEDGLSTNQVIVRTITANCPTALDNADDTNNTAADFNYVIGSPGRNNSVVPTETVCPPAKTTTKKKCKKKKKGKKGEAAAKKKKCKKKKKKK
jgi:hypothetical protein